MFRIKGMRDPGRHQCRKKAQRQRWVMIKDHTAGGNSCATRVCGKGAQSLREHLGNRSQEEIQGLAGLEFQAHFGEKLTPMGSFILELEEVGLSFPRPHGHKNFKGTRWQPRLSLEMDTEEMSRGPGDPESLRPERGQFLRPLSGRRRAREGGSGGPRVATGRCPSLRASPV